MSSPAPVLPASLVAALDTALAALATATPPKPRPGGSAYHQRGEELRVGRMIPDTRAALEAALVATTVFWAGEELRDALALLTLDNLGLKAESAALETALEAAREEAREWRVVPVNGSHSFSGETYGSETRFGRGDLSRREAEAEVARLRAVNGKQISGAKASFHDILNG